MKILHVIPSVNLRDGGPMEGVRNLAKEWIAMGHIVEIVSLDDPRERSIIQAMPIPVHALGPSLLRYKYSARLVPWLRKNASRFDAVIVNGIWQYHSFAVWRALAGGPVPYVVFTHGMLDPWFKHAYPLKHLKKWLYWPWADYRVLRDSKTVIFTCEEERRLARQSFWFYKCREQVTIYGTAPPPEYSVELVEGFLNAWPQLRDKRIVLFLGRIHEKKGCDLLIEAFAQVAGRDPGLHLVMAGPDQSGWASELKARAERLGIADRVTWTGMLSGDLKWGAFHVAEVFSLPSHQENFGIAVVEALGCGKPVLISNKVNIYREIEEDGAGWVGADTLEGTFSCLERWLASTPEEQTNMQVAARRSFNRRFTINTVAKRLLELLRDITARKA